MTLAGSSNNDLRVLAISGSLRKASFNTGLLRAASQVQDVGCRKLWSHYVRVGGYTPAGEIPARRAAIDRHIISHLIGNIFCHDLGDHAITDTNSAPLALSHEVGFSHFSYTKTEVRIMGAIRWRS